MKPGAGKRKGNAFENLMARELSRWLTEGKDGTQLIPSRLSGGWKDAAWRQAGDLAPNGEEGEAFRRRFVVECKHHNKDLLWELLRPGKRSTVGGWWHKLTKQAADLSLVPLLMFRQNGRPILCAMPTWLGEGFRPSAVVRETDEGVPFAVVPWETLRQVEPSYVYLMTPGNGDRG